MSRASDEASSKFFKSLVSEVASLDPVAFAEQHLTIDGHPFNMTGNGYKWLTDLYREVAAQATSPTAKPMVILKGRQVGATILAAVLSLYFTASGIYGTAGKPPMRVLHVFPTLGIMAKYAKDKLNPMMQGSIDNYIGKRALKNDKKIGRDAQDDTITEKTFLNFCKLRVDSIGRNADRLRGLTQDVLMLDEVQDMAKGAIENALRILTKAQYGPRGQGVQLFFGTPKNGGSTFWYMWEDSDQRFFQPRCVKCGEYFFFYTIGSEEWKKIWVKKQEIECPCCGHHQDKRDAIEGGRWKATRDSIDGRPCKYVGYHINLILSPEFTKEQVLDLDPSINKNRSERAWRNETLGEFYSSGGVPLSREEISWDETRRLSSGVRDNSDKIYTMGIDWGDKADDDETIEEGGDQRGQSYTAIVVNSIDRRGIMTVENAYRLKRNDFEYKIEVVQELFRRFRIRGAAADYMWGSDVVNHMQGTLNYGSKFLGCVNSGSLAAMLSYKPKEQRVILNKDLMLDEVFTMFRKGKIVFPGMPDAAEKLAWLVDHCTSMEVRSAIRYGSPIKKYVKGLAPNDGLMALLYSIIAYRFIATSGFKNNQDSVSASEAPLPLLAFMPGKM